MNSSCKFSSSAWINYLLLFAAGLIWGSQYILNKIALESFSTSMIAAGRVGIGALVLTLFVALKIEKPSPLKATPSFWSYLPDFILIGFLEATIPCVLVAWAQLYLASSIAAILIGTVPLFTTLLEALFIKGKVISLQKGIAVLLGFLGIVVLVGPGLLSHESGATNGAPLLLPILAILTSAFCFALAMLLIQVRLGSALGPTRTAQGILIGASITTLPLALWVTKPWLMISFHPATSALLALITLGIFCGGLVYTLFVMLINRAGPSFASMTNYLVPPIGAFIGIAFSGEKLTMALVSSLAVILFSLWLSSEKNK